VGRKNVTHPQIAVSKRMEHNIQVSGKHYANHVPDELFDKAAQNQAQQCVVYASDVSQAETGGGGNRTPVPWHFNHGLYVRSRLV